MKIVAIILISLVIFILLPFLFLFICGLFVDAKKQYDRDSRFFRGLLDGSTTVILWCLGVRYNIVGEEKFPAEGNFLFISNHRSNYDPIIQWTVFKRYKISFISKKENFKIPIVNKLMRSKECRLLPFHSGVLKVAQKAGRPIVVSTIEGTENIFRNIRRFRKTVVTIKILETIDADRVKSTKTSELSDYCAGLMKNELEEQEP